MGRNITYLIVIIAVLGFFTQLTLEGSRISPEYPGPGPGEALNLDMAEGGLPHPSAVRSACDISRDNCGSITPIYNTVFTADGAYNPVDNTIFFCDVPSGSDGTFQFDPVTCTVVSGTYYTVNFGLSERGMAFDPNRYRFWEGGWGDYYMNQYEATPPYAVVEYNWVGLPVASGAVDPANDYLFIGTNAFPDMVYAYDISTGSLGSVLGSWAVPWQTTYDGYDMAGMSFDDDSGQLVMVNQYAAGPGITREAFDVDLAGGLTAAGYCELSSTNYAWGIGLIEDGDPAPTTYYTYNPDITGFSPPFDVDEYGIPAVYPPTDLACEVTVDADVSMSWTNSQDYDNVNIYRNGGLIATLPGSSTSYLDVAPGTGFHTYGVSGVIGPDESGQVTCDVVVMPGGEVCFDFNETDGAWSAGGYSDWQWGTPSYVIDGNAWETNIGANYFNSSCGWLDSPTINLGEEGGWLSFDSYTYVECSWDGWNVQITTDGGATWSVIDPIFGYDQGVPYGACDEGLGGDTNCGYGEVETWDFDLTGYPNTTVMVRFLFESDSSVAYSGPVIDNVCVAGGTVPSVMIQCQLLNLDRDGDGVRDVHIGENMYYSATYINLMGEEVEYGGETFWYAQQTCPDPEFPVDHRGPECKGVLEPNGIATHYYWIPVPLNDYLLTVNPFVWEVRSWECLDGVPQFETGRCCMDVILLPGWEPPPVPEAFEGFEVFEFDGPPDFSN